MSLRVQLLLIFTLVFTLAFAVFATVFYRQFSTYAVDLAKDKLQSEANYLSLALATSITAEEIAEIYEEGEDAPSRQPLIDYFNEMQVQYPELNVEVSLVMVEPEARSGVSLIYLEADADESDPVETLEPEDDEIWEGMLLSAEQPAYAPIFEDESYLWTNSSEPVLDRDWEPTGAYVDVYIRTDNELAAVREQVRDTLLLAVAVGYPVLLFVIFLVAFTFTRALNRLTTAATAIEQDEPYQREWLQPVVRRGDEIGRLGRVFDKMANEVRSRVDRLKSEVVKLKIEIDQSRKHQQVAEITDSDYFKDLQEKAASVRRRVPKLNGEDEDEEESGE